MEKKSKPVNFEAFFLGPKAENSSFYAKLLREAFEQHCSWRKAFGHLDTEPFITEADKQKRDFREAQEKIEETLKRLHELLKTSQPCFSPRYIGHMLWETMAAPIIASFSAALYNPNNVARSASTGTSDLELEVANDFITLFGYDKKKAWGHICTGGTIANMEALWIARNMKVMPLALMEMLKHFKFESFIFDLHGQPVDIFSSKREFLLKAFNPEDIIALKDSVFNHLRNQKLSNSKMVVSVELDELFETLCMQKRGLLWSNNQQDANENNGCVDPGLVFLPSTKHYSLKKSMDLLGIGTNNIRYVPVNRNFRMDIEALERMIIQESKEKPVLAVVGVLGTTEESAVDQIDEIVALRAKLNQMNIGFHIHVDAAYGGYARSLFLDESGNFLTKEQLDDYLKEFGIIGDKPERNNASWPTPEVFKAFEAVSESDTITVDPHKLGYVLYPAGGIAIKDKRMREAIQVFAPYVFPKPKLGEPDILIGAYILEGSKPGASAAAVWTAHRIMPLNISGYGKLIGETIDGAQALYFGLEKSNPISLKDGIRVKAIPIIKPDLNIVNYFFNFEGNKNLEITNKLTAFIIDQVLGYQPAMGKTMISKEFIVSDTDLTEEEYQDSPLLFLSEIGITKAEWNRVKKIKVARSVIMSPYLTPDYVDENYVDLYIRYLEKQISAHENDLVKLFRS
jgi:tyrosine decarboxylase